MSRTATVVITTRNRSQELRRAIRSALCQSVAVEVIVVDDASTDDTAAVVRAEFPSVRFVRHQDAQGCVVRRNEAARIASGDVIFSLDDDAEFSSPSTVERTLSEFDHYRIGAVAIPYIEPLKQQVVMQHAPPGGGIWVTDCYVGTAHAVRRDVFLRLGGYREDLVHQGEERDFCIGLLGAGYVVRLGSADVINHFESPARDLGRMDYYGRLNDVRFAWERVPMPFAIGHLAATTINGLKAACRSRGRAAMLRGLVDGYKACWTGSAGRRPVSRDVYRLHRRLKKSGPYLLDQVAG